MVMVLSMQQWIKELDNHTNVQVINIYSPVEPDKIIKVIGNDQNIDVKTLTISDICISFILFEPFTKCWFNRWNRSFIKPSFKTSRWITTKSRVGIARMERVIRERMTTLDIETATPKTLINIRPITAVIKEFFGSSPLSQFMDQVIIIRIK